MDPDYCIIVPPSLDDSGDEARSTRWPAGCSRPVSRLSLTPVLAHFIIGLLR